MAQHLTAFQILAIDPAPSILDVYDRLLTETGYRTAIRTFDGRAAETIASLRPDLIILDGPWDHYGAAWDLLERLKRDPDTSAIPILICTFARRQIGMRAGRLHELNVAVLNKPFEQDAFLSAVNKLLPSAVPA